VRLLDWPSVADPDDNDACVYCESDPDQPHQPACPLYAPAFDDLMRCDVCKTEFFSRCACDGHDCGGEK
jgi:hypothetical protein